MPPHGKKKVHKSGKQSLGARCSTSSITEFQQMRGYFPDRLNIISEGDSWFAYPPKWLVNNAPANLIDHLSSWTRYKANFLAMATNGDEAVGMLSGAGKHDLIDLLRSHTQGNGGRPVDLLLFSGGGNDIVGENDFERFLQPYKPGCSAEQCVHLVRLRRKARQIGLAYEELADIRDHYSPDTVIMTHTYDYPYPSDQGAEFVGGMLKLGPWMKPFMDHAGVGIPRNLQRPVARIFMDELAAVLRNIEGTRRKFVVVDTRGTLKNQESWTDEIHPTSDGFATLAGVIWWKMVEAYPQLRG